LAFIRTLDQAQRLKGETCNNHASKAAGDEGGVSWTRGSSVIRTVSTTLSHRPNVRRVKVPHEEDEEAADSDRRLHLHLRGVF
jgi:hypothetical protein